MTLRGITPAWLCAITAEIDARRSANVRAVHQDSRFRFRIALESSTGRTDIVVDLDPDFPRMHLHAPQKAPAKPSALAASMRNLIQGAALEGATSVSGERAAALRFVLHGEKRTLWVELFGRQANLYLLDEDDVVRTTCRGEVAKTRSATVGDPFTPVPLREPPANDEGPEPGGSPSQQLVERYAGEGAERELDRARFIARRALKRRARSYEKRVAQLEAARDRLPEADELHRRGELLRGSFHVLRPGLEHVTVVDYETDPPTDIELPLQPGLEPGEQVAWCFRRERKLRTAAERAVATLGDFTARLAGIEQVLSSLDACTAREALDASLADLDGDTRKHVATALGPAQQSGQRQKAATRREFVSLDGWPIWVGRNARESDALTLHASKPHDLFLHVRGAPGSHVIVPTPRGKTVPKDTLLDAAQLACLFSKRSEAEHNEVDYVERRHVRKPRGAAPGLVTVERAKTLTVRLDPARRARLRASRP